MSHIFEDLDIRVNMLCNERDSVADSFKAIVRDGNLPLAERVACWEDNAKILLDLGQWRSYCPEALLPFFGQFNHRGETLLFEDLVESLVLVDDWSDLYQITDEELWARLDHVDNLHIRQRFEQVFNLDVYGYRVDW